MPEAKVTVSIGPGKEITLSTGKIAKLANGSCVIRQGDTTVLRHVPAPPNPVRISSRCRSTTVKNIPRQVVSPAATSNAKVVLPTRKF